MRTFHPAIPIMTLFALALLAACAGQATPAAPQPSEVLPTAAPATEVVLPTDAPATEAVMDATLFKGKSAAEFYQGSCARCHGANRGGGRGPALLPDRLSEGDEIYFDIIKNGESGGMPAWGNQLTDEEIGALVAFMRSEPN